MVETRSDECVVCEDVRPTHSVLRCLHTLCEACAREFSEDARAKGKPCFACSVCWEQTPLAQLLGLSLDDARAPQNAESEDHRRAVAADRAEHEMLIELGARLGERLAHVDEFLAELEVLETQLLVEQTDLTVHVSRLFHDLQAHDPQARDVLRKLVDDGRARYQADVKATELQREDAKGLRARLCRCAGLVQQSVAAASAAARPTSALRTWASALCDDVVARCTAPVAAHVHIYMGSWFLTARNMHYDAIVSEFRHRASPVRFAESESECRPTLLRAFQFLEHVSFCEQLTRDTLLICDRKHGLAIWSCDALEAASMRKLDVHMPKCPAEDVQICPARKIWVLSPNPLWNGTNLWRFDDQGESLAQKCLNGIDRHVTEFLALPGGLVLVQMQKQGQPWSVDLYSESDEHLWSHPVAEMWKLTTRAHARLFNLVPHIPLLSSGCYVRRFRECGTRASPHAGLGWLLPFRDCALSFDGGRALKVEGCACADTLVTLAQPGTELNPTMIRNNGCIIADIERHVWVLSGGRCAVLATGPKRQWTAENPLLVIVRV